MVVSTFVERFRVAPDYLSKCPCIAALASVWPEIPGKAAHIKYGCVALIL